MSNTRSMKSDRITVRVRPQQKHLLEQAASLRALSVSALVVKYACEGAQRTVQESKVWTLLSGDREVFVESLLKPPHPSAELQHAAKRYKQRMAEK